MASVVEAKCNCGLYADRLLCGAFRIGDSSEIHVCYNCGSLKSLKSKDAKNASCENCQNPLMRIEYYRDDYYPCPRCGKREMRLMAVMMAD